MAVRQISVSLAHAFYLGGPVPAAFPNVSAGVQRAAMVYLLVLTPSVSAVTFDGSMPIRAAGGVVVAYVVPPLELTDATSLTATIDWTQTTWQGPGTLTLVVVDEVLWTLRGRRAVAVPCRCRWPSWTLLCAPDVFLDTDGADYIQHGRRSVAVRPAASLNRRRCGA